MYCIRVVNFCRLSPLYEFDLILMNADIASLDLFTAAIGVVISVVGILVTIMIYLFRRLERSVKDLDAKLEHSVEQLRSDNKELDAKLERSVEQLRSDSKKLDAKLERSVEQLDAKLERIGSKLYNLNGKVNRLLGHTFGVGSLIEEDEADMRVNS